MDPLRFSFSGAVSPHGTLWFTRRDNQLLKSVIGIYYSTARHQWEEIQQLWPNSILNDCRQGYVVCSHRKSDATKETQKCQYASYIRLTFECAFCPTVQWTKEMAASGECESSTKSEKNTEYILHFWKNFWMAVALQSHRLIDICQRMSCIISCFFHSLNIYFGGKII